jgi:hypothetical protein
MAYAENENKETLVFDLRNKPVVADAVFPELPKFRAAQGLSDTAGLAQIGHASIKEIEDSSPGLRIEFVEFPVG